MIELQSLEAYFKTFQQNIIGENHYFDAGYGNKKLLYADWLASGRLYSTIEETMRKTIGPRIANTHSFSSYTGTFTTNAYRFARQRIKEHLHAGENDVLITTGTGMTAALSKLQRLMGLKGVGQGREKLPPEQRPVVFISEMEHHSHQVPWMETIADVVMISSSDTELICLKELERQLEKFRERPLKIGAFTACSNVTGLITDYHSIAKLMHHWDGYCFVDFAASAPYVSIDMHPRDKEEQLDAVYFSPHKFLGGPGSTGVLVFNKALYNACCPDNPGGGNVKWTRPDNSYAYYDDIETREDGGTPGFLQVIRAALAIQLKERMGVEHIRAREEELLRFCYEQFRGIPGLYILGDTEAPRIGCVSFGIEGIHYNLIVRLLNDRFGIQVRGGWSCASTYAHHLFSIDKNRSQQMLGKIEQNDLSEKPGWVRLSLHPTLSNEQLGYICHSISQIQENYQLWQMDYAYNKKTNEFESKTLHRVPVVNMEDIFKI